MKVRFFEPGKGYKKIRSKVLKEIDRILSVGDLILREDVDKFEKSLAKFVGTKYAVALNSGTDALYLALKAIGIKPDDNVLVPSHTFVATVQVVAQIGANPVLYDHDGGFCGDRKIAAMICAHITGEIDSKINIDCPIVEDACQALGAVKNPRSLIQCWSFYPAKILGAYGDAGAITTNSEEIYNEIRELRNHYKKDYSKWGINSRMDNLQATILNIKLKHLPKILAKRKEIADMYLKRLKGDVGLPNNPKGRVWQDFVIRVDDRDKLHEFLKKQGIETMKNEYPMPCGKLPLAKKYESETLRIPCNENLTKSEVNYVIKTIKKYYGQN